MKKNCNLIITIPAMTDLTRVEKAISNPHIYGARWNTGIVTPYTESDTIGILQRITDKYKKNFWVDLKGRQLRVLEWGNPMYDSIRVNHRISVDLPAKLVLRNEEPLQLVKVKGNQLFVSPLPKHSVGRGQSVNILGNNLKIEGYLTEQDKIYLKICKKLGINKIMTSFVESSEDIMEIKILHPNSEIICKIESKKGIGNLEDLAGFDLMAARDDLYLELENPSYMTYSLQKIINQNENAICASRIFTSLEHSPTISYSDFEDLEMMYNMGYRNFMLCDNVSNFVLDKALKGWECFING